MAEEKTILEGGVNEFEFDSIPNVGMDLDFKPADEIKTLDPEFKGQDLNDNYIQEEEEKENTNKLFLGWAKDKGIIEDIPDDFEDTDDNITDIIRNNIDKKANSLADEKLNEKLKDLPEVYKQYLNYHNTGYDISNLLKSEERLKNYESISDSDINEDEDLQKNILISSYLRSGYSQDEAIKKYNRMYDKDIDLVREESKEEFEKLKKLEIENYKNLKLEAEEFSEKQERQREESIKKYESEIMGIQEIFPGVKIDNNIKKKIFDGLTKVVHTDKSGKPMNELNKMQSEDPMFLPRLYYVAKILNWDLSKHKSSETKILNDLKGKMNSYPSNKDIDSTILKLRKAIKKNSNSLF